MKRKSALTTVEQVILATNGHVKLHQFNSYINLLPCVNLFYFFRILEEHLERAGVPAKHRSDLTERAALQRPSLKVKATTNK